MDPSSSIVLHNNKRKRDDDDDSAFGWCKRPKHDVFLSYCNEEIGKKFVSHLKGSLHRNGFNISDNTTLCVGQDECSELLNAIQESWIYVVVFSSKYPFSVSCLDELVLIMDSVSKSKKRTVFPIFYKVDPSHVRSQQDASFLEAFRGHRVDGERVEKWRHALQDVGNRAGEHFHTWDNEEEYVRKIVKALGKFKLPLELLDTEHPVGIEPRAQQLISELNLADPHPSITAVLGMSGSGKTTLVKAVYDTMVQTRDFDATCFIEDIRYYKHNGPNWKVVLQHDVISRFTGDDYRIHNVVAATVRNFVRSRKVLLVLDDVDKYEQLEALGVHNHASFGWGSRILVTTTNKQSLSGLQKCPSYEISLLNRSESFQLFVRLAYAKEDPVDEKFVEEIVWRTGGLPLLLEVWGLHFKSHERKQWPTLLESLRRIPHEKVQKKLQESYDALTSLRTKNLFLDIACFFEGWKKDEVIKVLEDKDTAFFPDIEIKHLIHRGLVREEEDDDGDQILRMHEVIMEMGKEVVRQENEDDPGQRSRLYRKDVVCVLRDYSGTDAVRSIYLDLDDILDEDVTVVQIEAFRKMSNLRFIKLVDDYFRHILQCSCSNSEINYRLCFKHLKYLEWLGFPFKCMDNIEMGNVVVIRLLDSKLETLWEGALKSLKKLRILDVTESNYLVRTGSFIGLENLENLNLSYCVNLEELDTSIGCLQKLRVLDLHECEQLKRVPWEMIGKLTSLVKLDLNECPNILNISHQLGNLKSLQELDLGGNSFPSLPDSLCQLHRLKKLDISFCDNLKSIPSLPPNIREVEARVCSSLESLPSNMSELRYLTRLDLDYCKQLRSQGFMMVTVLRNLQNLSMRYCNVSQVCSEIGNMVSLVELYLSGNTFTSLPDNVSNLSQLKELEIRDCHKLKFLPLLPSKLRYILASGCELLDVMPYDSRKLGYMFRSQWCRHLQLVNSQQHDPSALYTHLTIKLSLWNKEEEVAIPEWCSYSSMSGEELCFVAPPALITTMKICGVIFYCNTDCVSSVGITMINKTKGTSHRFMNERAGYVLMGLYPLNDGTIVVEAGDILVVHYHQGYGFVPWYGVRLIYENDVVDDSTLLFSNSSSINQQVCILSKPGRKQCIYNYKLLWS